MCFTFQKPSLFIGMQIESVLSRSTTCLRAITAQIQYHVPTPSTISLASFAECVAHTTGAKRGARLNYAFIINQVKATRSEFPAQAI